MNEPQTEAIIIDQNTAVQSEEPLVRPDGVYSLGKVYRPLVGDGTGLDDSAVFLTLEDAQAYVRKHYPNARPFSGDTRYASLNSLDPGINPNQYLIQVDDVWTTTRPQDGDSLLTRLNESDPFNNLGGLVIYAYEDRNIKGATYSQRSNKFSIKIGTWVNEGEARVYYQVNRSDKTIRTGSDPVQTVNNIRKIQEGEIYLQPRGLQLREK